MVAELLEKCARSGTDFHRNIKYISRAIETIEKGYTEPITGEKERIKESDEFRRIKLLAADMIMNTGTMQMCGMSKEAISSRKDMAINIMDYANKQDKNAIKKEILDFEIYQL